MNDSSMRVRGSLSARLDGAPAAVRDAEVLLPQRPARVAVELDAVAVVDELADRDAFGELRQAAHVIAVEVGDQHVVELGDAGLPAWRPESGRRHAGPAGASRRPISTDSRSGVTTRVAAPPSTSIQ